MNDEQACRQAYDDFYHKVRAEVGYDHWAAIWRFIRKRSRRLRPIMTTKTDGGPAFPIPCEEDVKCGPRFESGYGGLTLRDYFAAKAMQGLLTKHGGYEDDMSAPYSVVSFSENAPNVDQAAEYAYAQADAMIKARES